MVEVKKKIAKHFNINEKIESEILDLAYLSNFKKDLQAQSISYIYIYLSDLHNLNKKFF